MTNTTRKLALSLLTLGAIATTAVGQSPYHLPSQLGANRTAAVKTHLGDWKLGAALREMLNSNGDKVKFDLAAAAKLKSRTGSLKFEVEIERKEQTDPITNVTRVWYEIAMTREQGASLGFDSGAEKDDDKNKDKDADQESKLFDFAFKANLGGNRSRKVVFRFSSLEDLGSGLRQMALGASIGLNKALAMTRAVMQGARQVLGHAEDLYRDTLRALEVGRRAEQVARGAFNAASATLGSISTALRNARSAHARASRALRAVQSRLDSYYWVPAWLKNAVAGARRALDAVGRGLRAAQSRYDRALRDFRSKKARLDAAAAALRQRIESRANAARNRDQAKAHSAEAEQAYAAVASLYEGIATFFQGFELKSTVQLDAAASATFDPLAALPLPTEKKKKLQEKLDKIVEKAKKRNLDPKKLGIVNCEISAETKGSLDIAVELDFQERVLNLSFTAVGEATVKGEASLGLGRKGNVALKFQYQAKTTLPWSGDWDGQIVGKSAMDVTIKNVPSIGYIVKGEMGWQRVVSVDLTGVGLDGATTMLVKDSRCHGVGFELGLEIKKVGVTISGSGNWNDTGKTHETRAKGIDVLRSIGQSFGTLWRMPSWN